MLFSLIRRRKEEEAKAAQQAQRDQAFVSPPGHRRMADEERLSTLQALEEGNYSISLTLLSFRQPPEVEARHRNVELNYD